MTRRLNGVILSAAALLSLTACATSSRFVWGDYETALYAYARSPDRREVYREALQEAVTRGVADDRLAPGLMAELGYLHLEDGDTAGAVEYFEEEMRRFPESRALLSRVVGGLRGGSPVAAPMQSSGAGEGAHL